MLFAWYGHLKTLGGRPWYVAAIASSLAQLKIIQEVVTLVVFVPFALLYMRQPIKLDYLWASFCLAGAVYFVFRGA